MRLVPSAGMRRWRARWYRRTRFARCATENFFLRWIHQRKKFSVAHLENRVRRYQRARQRRIPADGTSLIDPRIVQNTHGELEQLFRHALGGKLDHPGNTIFIA